MKNYLNRIAALTLALMLSVSVPFAVGAEEATEDANVQAENIILPEVEEPAAAAEEPAIEVPAVVASVRISCQNLGSCEYFGDRLFLKADIKNGDGSESVSWQVNENYASGSGNWAHVGNGATLSVTITPAIAQYGYRCVLSTGAMSSVFVVDKSFSERPVEPATVEAEPVAEEKTPETAAPAEPVKEEPKQEETAQAEKVEEVKVEEKVEEAKTEEVKVEEKVEEVKTEEKVEEKIEEEKIEEKIPEEKTEEAQPETETVEVIENEAATESEEITANVEEVLPEEEIEFEDEEVLEFDDDDWGTTESDLFTAFDDLANSFVEESEETTEDNVISEEHPEENAEKIISEDNTNEELDEDNTNEVTSEDIIAEEIEKETTDETTEEETTNEDTSEEIIDKEDLEENIDEDIQEENTTEVISEENADEITEEENVNEEIIDEDAADEETAEIIPEENADEMVSDKNNDEVISENEDINLSTEEAEEAIEEVIQIEEKNEIEQETVNEESIKEAVGPEAESVSTEGMKQMLLVLRKGEAGTNLYAAPSDGAAVLSFVSTGAEIYLAKFDANWSQVVVNDIKGYVKNEYLAMFDNGDMTEEEKEVFRSVSIHNPLVGMQYIAEGTPVTMTVVLTGFDDIEYSVQWSYSKDGTTFTEIVGAHDLTYTYAVNKQNVGYYWSVEINTLDEEMKANE